MRDNIDIHLNGVGDLAPGTLRMTHTVLLMEGICGQGEETRLSCQLSQVPECHPSLPIIQVSSAPEG